MANNKNITAKLYNKNGDLDKLKKVLFKSNLNKTIKEVLVDLIKETRQNYPLSLKVSDMAEITNYSENSIYLLLEHNKIPAAKKLKGWRVPRDIFLIWWYGEFYEDNINSAI